MASDPPFLLLPNDISRTDFVREILLGDLGYVGWLAGDPLLLLSPNEISRTDLVRKSLLVEFGYVGCPAAPA